MDLRCELGTEIIKKKRSMRISVPALEKLFFPGISVATHSRTCGYYFDKLSAETMVVDCYEGRLTLYRVRL